MAMLSFALVSAVPAAAQMLYDQGPPAHRFVHRQALVGRLNPLGSAYEGRFMYRLRLYESASVALRDNFLGAGAFVYLSPGFLHVGPYVEFQPLSVLGFWATYLYSQYFRTFGLFQSFPSPNAEFSDAELSRRAALPKTDPLSNYVTNGGQLIIGADFQVKVWQVLLRSKARLLRSDYRVREGDTVFFEQTYDLLVPNHGWFFTNDADVMWQKEDHTLMLGARYTASTAFYDRSQYLEGETPTNLNASHRVGPFAAYAFRVQDGATFNQPTVFLLAQWFVMHRYRTGEQVSQAIPLVMLGFQVSGDFLAVPKN